MAFHREFFHVGQGAKRVNVNAIVKSDTSTAG